MGQNRSQSCSKIGFAALVATGLITSRGLAQETAKIDLQPINYSLDRSITPFSSAGLIRFLEEGVDYNSTAPQTIEDVATSTLISEEQTRSRQPDGTGLTDSPGYSEPFSGPITLAPLVTPNTITAGIGTNALPEDMVNGRLPKPIALPTGTTRDNPPLTSTKTWVPGGFCRQPLYWEDPMLERHGHQSHPILQPVCSGAKFYGTFLVLPYLATLRDPLSDVHTLGSYSPGSPAPALRFRPHYDAKAIRNQVIMSGAATAISAP